MIESIGDALVLLLEMFGWTADLIRQPEKPHVDEQASIPSKKTSEDRPHPPRSAR